MSCKTCKYLDVPLDKLGRRITRKYYVYQCTCPLPQMPSLPDSVTGHYTYTPILKGTRQFMERDMGESCPCYEPIKKGGK